MDRWQKSYVCCGGREVVCVCVKIGKLKGQFFTLTGPRIWGYGIDYHDIVGN